MIRVAEHMLNNEMMLLLKTEGRNGAHPATFGMMCSEEEINYHAKSLKGGFYIRLEVC